MLKIFCLLCFIVFNLSFVSLKAEDTLVDESTSKGISDSLSDQDNIREEIQNLNSQIEELKSKLNEKNKVEEDLKKELLQYKDKDFKNNFYDNSSKELQSLLLVSPFNIKNDKNTNYNQGYDALVAKEYVVAENYFQIFIKEEKGITDTNDKKDDKNLDKLQNEDPNIKEKTPEESANIPKKTEISGDNDFLSKANFFMGEIKLLDMNFKESFSYFTDSYKLSNDYDVSINSLFKISVIFALQNKNKELCFTLLRIKQTLDLEQNKNHAFYVDRLKSLEDAYPCD